ncbi:hypothetical protein H5P28_17005 [Ruficoccus amylovorans]|uniref:Prepilin-type N-terminal cleavage/methylation domain-containing protein n=1 Tax=Ruficoccus amylovorans TaxID=1804625 RepID=A0A842HKG6_9BACT|nr:hypothetical protein [Ruficoccus amylovorans]MBC2595967.1 hypothetical protein [Ruficoccus amylovorans]
MIELLAVVVIIGILAAILIPVSGMIRHKANQSICASNMRQLGTASKLYTNEHGGKLISTPYIQSGYWFQQLYHYLDVKQRASGTSKVFTCPEDEEAIKELASGNSEWARLSYLLLKENQEWSRINEIDDPARSPAFIDADQPATNDYKSEARFISKVKGADGWRHGAGVNVCYWDGSVRYIENPTYAEVFYLNE